MSEVIELKGIVDLSRVVKQKVLADIIGVSGKTVSELKSKKIITDGQPLGEWLHRYCSHIREQAAGRATLGDLDLATERAGLAKEQRIRLEMQNAVTRREYAPISSMEIGLSDVMARVGSQLDSIVGKLKKRSDVLTANDLDVVAAVIASVRNEIAETAIDWFDDMENESDDTETTVDV